MNDCLLDTSTVVKRYVAETGTTWVTAWTDPAAGNTCWLAAITRVELLAALYRRVRKGTVTSAQARQAETVFRHELSTHYVQVPVRSPILDRAMLLVAAYPLRAYDAVQLATALQLQSSRAAPGGLPLLFICSDQELSRAATAEGLRVDDPNLHP